MYLRLGVVMVLVAFINMIDTLAFGARLAGVRTHSPSLAMSLYNIVALTARTANLIQLPLVASIVDKSLQAGEGAPLLFVFRFIIFANSLGTLVGILFLPLSVRTFTWGIGKMEKFHSVPVVAIEFLRPANIKKAVHVPLASLRHLKSIEWSRIPLTFIFTNPILVSFYSVGVLASIYAGYLIPEYRLTASQLSGIINGIATVLLVVIVDPISALILDETLKGKREEAELKSAIGLLAGGKFLGTLLAQILLVPAAQIIAFITRVIT
ncbi:DUF2837 family protein [Thermanaerosceptrum fracticalcis]|jgi:hypothetical protein|uniref:Lipid II flippase Amj n=1 Tax=Thermanaerosceptrum fracticalcis TaxID=1712410 RepID=A0A7G6E7R5_THEFR|nr:DUF2837 family protein [Thermanaerosceptrum fracticalcis]QNB48119.1 DUF2837 family protein [Thermanaerosceptrum fracticalcis]